jgi:hypothetical protein
MLLQFKQFLFAAHDVFLLTAMTVKCGWGARLMAKATAVQEVSFHCSQFLYVHGNDYLCNADGAPSRWRRLLQSNTCPLQGCGFISVVDSFLSLYCSHLVYLLTMSRQQLFLDCSFPFNFFRVSLCYLPIP